MLPQPLPLLDVNVTIWNKGLGRASIYELNSILCCLMFVRFFYVPRFYGECISDLQSESTVALGRMNRVKIDESFILKYVIANSMQVVIVLTLLQIVMFAYMMMVFERPVDNGALQHFANCVWLTIITMTTVGYGDEFPTTLLGRMVSVMASIVAVVMLAITVNLVISKLTLSRAESKVISVMDKITLRKDLKHKAAVVIQRWIRAHKEYMEGERRGSNRGGYMMIPDLKSARRKNMDLRAQVNLLPPPPSSCLFSFSTASLFTPFLFLLSALRSSGFRLSFSYIMPLLFLSLVHPLTALRVSGPIKPSAS